MARSGRNGPCPCGSGRKAKRCCGVERGPSERELARARVAMEARRAARAARALAALDDRELDELWDELRDLPARDLSLQIELPELVSPELDRLLDAVVDDDPDEAREVLPAVLAKVDTPQTRARLARAIVDLRDGGRLDSQLAAAGLIDLASKSQLVVRASLLRAAAVATGVARTPGGLMVAA